MSADRRPPPALPPGPTPGSSRGVWAGLAATLLFGCGRPVDTPTDPGTSTSPTESTATTTLPAAAPLTVQVTLDGVPTEGITVLQGGKSTRWTTGPDGTVTIEVDHTLDADIVVMASHPDARIGGEMIGVDEPQPLVIALTRFSRTDNHAYVFQDPGEGDPFQSSTEVCLHCHISIHEAWWASPHRTSASNPTVHDLYQGTASALDAATCATRGGTWEEVVVPGSKTSTEGCRLGSGVLPDTAGYGGCADCHAPAIDGALGGRDLLDARGVSYAYGVHCDLCHKVESVDLGQPPGVAGALRVLRPSEPSTSPVFGDWDPLTFGPWDDVINPRMGSVARPGFHEAAICGGCHQAEQAVLVTGAKVDTTRWPTGLLPVHTTYAEWEASPFAPSAPCQSCHMPPDPAPASGADLYDGPGHETGTEQMVGVATGWERPPGSVRRHAWYGPRQRESGMLALAASVDVAPTLEGTSLVVRATVKNVGPGHALPTGEPLRALLLGVRATCGDTPLLPTGGDVLPEWAGWLDRRAAPDQWPGAAVGDVIRVVRRTGTWVDYVGFGPFGDGRFTADAKGIPGEVWAGEATVTAVDGDTVTLSGPLPSGDVYYRVAGAARAGEPGWAFARVMVDAAGDAMVPHFAAVDVASDNRLLPQAAWTSTHTFASPCDTPSVTATLVHRNYPWALANTRGWAIDDQVMATVTRTVP